MCRPSLSLDSSSQFGCGPHPESCYSGCTLKPGRVDEASDVAGLRISHPDADSRGLRSDSTDVYQFLCNVRAHPLSRSGAHGRRLIDALRDVFLLGYILDVTRPLSGSSMVTIQGFPEELLLIVVQMVQRREQQSHGSRSLSRSRSALRSLLRLSLVCKGWRETILESGVLWASIAVDTSRDDCLVATLAMLERSKGAELELSVYFHTDKIVAERTGSVVASILDHHTRIASLHLTADPPFTLKSYIPVLETTTHALTTIDSLPTPALSRPAPGLFCGLRDLALTLPSPSTVVRTSELLDIVKNSQVLESLSLTSFLFIKEDSICVAHPPRLRQLSLWECDSAIILSHLAAPKTAIINITLKNRRVRGYPSLHGVHILSGLPPSLSSMHTLEETTKLIFEENEKGRYFGLGLASFHSRGSLVTIRNRSSSRERFIRASLRAISDHPYFDVIESFTFSCTSCISMSWSMVFSRFSALLELNTLTVHATDVLHTLVQTTFDGTPLCFSLRRIRFFERSSNRGHACLYSELFTVFHSFRAERHCSAVRITLHYLDGRKEEL